MMIVSSVFMILVGFVSTLSGSHRHRGLELLSIYQEPAVKLHDRNSSHRCSHFTAIHPSWPTILINVGPNVKPKLDVRKLRKVIKK